MSGATYEFGDVVLVPFPFTNHAASKRRPAVIVSNHAYNLAKPDIIVMAVTSQLRPLSAAGEVGVRSRRGGPRHSATQAPSTSIPSDSAAAHKS